MQTSDRANRATIADRVSKSVARIRGAARVDRAAVKSLLATPCGYRPGSIDKLAVMITRHEMGLPVQIEGDADVRCDGAAWRSDRVCESQPESADRY